ncbi:hypothetical protein BH11VER1_BH11VER1_13520 [soil metagenome]
MPSPDLRRFTRSITILLRATLCLAGSLSQALALDRALTIASPVNLQVLQRDGQEMGRVSLSGRVDEAATEVRYRIIGKSLQGELEDVWKTASLNSREHTFKQDLVLPAGGWYHLEVAALVEGKELAKESVDRFGVGEVFIIAGQSNSGNYGSEKLETKSGMVASYDGKEWHPGNDPQKGAGGSGGSYMPAFGDALFARLGVPIGLVPIAQGGTSVREWLPVGIRFKEQTTTGGGVKKVGDDYESNGVLFDRLCKAMNVFGKNGFRAVLWHQGESDAGQARGGYPLERQITGPQYAAFMEQLIHASRKDSDWEVPWLTAVTTYHSEKDAADEEFRIAMMSLWSRGLSVPGPDTDALRGGLRAGVHFNAKGLQLHGELWALMVAAWMGGQ